MGWGVSSDAIDYLFASTTANTQANMDALAATILAQGLDQFQSEKYDQAINSFKRAAALSPRSDNSSKAYDFIGQAYLKQEKTDQAIKTYKEAIRIYPTNDTFHLALGDIYLQESLPEEALAEFEAAVNLNPEDEESRYSLGQSYITAAELDKAREQFAAVTRLSPESAAGFYGLGQVAHLSGNLEEAATQLNRAIRVNKGFELAYLELGYVYADMGEFQKAEDLSATLDAKGSDKVATLDAYISLAREPRIIGALSPNGFNVHLGPKTSVSALSRDLSAAGKSKLFEMNVAFSKDMDEASVINPDNWKISRASLGQNGGVYNYGLKPPAGEAVIQPSPSYVTFNKKTNTATLYFRLSQNSTANATIDPNHIVFKFSGLDAYGKAMDTSADEYSGFSGVA
ncbi:MAG: tetratricopeptide repeat protein [Deltaproteobacteria bacterium]